MITVDKNALTPYSFSKSNRILLIQMLTVNTLCQRMLTVNLIREQFQRFVSVPPGGEQLLNNELELSPEGKSCAISSCFKLHSFAFFYGSNPGPCTDRHSRQVPCSQATSDLDFLKLGLAL